MKVYLCGPIRDSADRFGWRSVVAHELAKVGIETLDPTRGMKQSTKKYPPALATPQAIVGRDFDDVRRCDAVLACMLEDEIVSIGSVAEIGWCHLLRKPLALIATAGGVYDHPFCRVAATWWTSDVHEATNALKIFFGRHR